MLAYHRASLLSEASEVMKQEHWRYCLGESSDFKVRPFFSWVNQFSRVEMPEPQCEGALQRIKPWYNAAHFQYRTRWDEERRCLNVY
jgi:hypothetical protein